PGREEVVGLAATRQEVVVEMDRVLPGGEALDRQAEGDHVALAVGGVVPIEVTVLPSLARLVGELVEVDAKRARRCDGRGRGRGPRRRALREGTGPGLRLSHRQREAPRPCGQPRLAERNGEQEQQTEQRRESAPAGAPRSTGS